MMLHAAIHWPDATDATQWPMAVMYATYCIITCHVWKPEFLLWTFSER
jgi:hypothetical protein